MATTKKKTVSTPVTLGSSITTPNGTYERNSVISYDTTNLDNASKYTQKAANTAQKKNGYVSDVRKNYNAANALKPITSQYQDWYNSALKKATGYGDIVNPYQNQINALAGNVDPGEFYSKYDEKVDEALAKLEADYDPETDAMYQNYKNAYMRGGQQAMQNALAQAAALTGGYGSSYGQSAGQQTYQQYMAGLADKIPELAQAAQEMYQNRLNNYMTLGNRDYSRWDADRGYNLNALATLDSLGNSAVNLQNMNIGNAYRAADAIGGAYDRDVNLQGLNQDLAFRKLDAALNAGNFDETLRQNKINNYLGIGGQYSDLFNASKAVTDSEVAQFNDIYDRLEAEAKAAAKGSGGGGGGRGGSSKSSDYDTDILTEINWGLEHGLSPEQMQAYLQNRVNAGEQVKFPGTQNVIPFGELGVDVALGAVSGKGPTYNNPLGILFDRKKGV